MKLGSFLTIALSLAMTAGVAQAQNVLDASDEMAAGGTASVTISGEFADVIQGWSFGLCNDPGQVAVSAVNDGATTAALNGGAGADFNQVNMFADGWTVGIVISFLGMDTIMPGTGYELHTADYDVLVAAPAPGDPDVVASLDYCDVLGVPPVATVVVSGGASITPTQDSGSITVVGVPPVPVFSYVAPAASGNYNPGDGAVSLTAGFGIRQNADGTVPAGVPFPADTQGFSMGCANDAVVMPTAVSVTGELATINGGSGPDFFGDNVAPGGWTVGVVYAFLGGVFIQFDVEKTVINVDYDGDAGILAGDLDGETSALTWVDTLGMPPVANVVVVGGASIAADGEDGSITLSPVTTQTYIRGDCNADGIVNIADGIWILNQLFFSGPSTDCNDACDANSDGMVDSSDATYIFNYRFLGGSPPAAPFPNCGDGGVDPMDQDCNTATCAP